MTGNPATDLHSEDPAVRKAALESLLAADGPDATKTAEALCNDPDAAIRARAAAWLAGRRSWISRDMRRFLMLLFGVPVALYALDWLLVPKFCGGMPEAQVSKAKQDLDSIGAALRLYESRYRPLQGNDLNQILGQTIQEIPKDPWGRPYMFRAGEGLLLTLGDDGAPGGEGADADLVLRFRSER